jgi:hypothetical protein
MSTQSVLVRVDGDGSHGQLMALQDKTRRTLSQNTVQALAKGRGEERKMSGTDAVRKILMAISCRAGPARKGTCRSAKVQSTVPASESSPRRSEAEKRKDEPLG